ncbi:helix-turn-helix domain-containing protein [Algoriphagus hitonicola]|uniref:helix-turn-helix domain-containing protein n=1 Tax=Algoriphagus hitonicola TaxID=435880 RepID=UPI00361F675A
MSKLAVEIEEIDTSKNPDSPKQVFSIGYSSLETNSDLSSQEKKRLIIISGYLEETRPYLDQKFSAKKIEEDLNISSKNIGNIIKKNFKMNFNQYVNKLRIEYALSQLESYPKWRAYTIEALANNVGFNSANSFYAYFKEYTGMTPENIF